MGTTIVKQYNIDEDRERVGRRQYPRKLITCGRLNYYWYHIVMQVLIFLHSALSLVVQCIVIGPVCVFTMGGRRAYVGVCVCGSVTMKTRNCMYRSSPIWVCR